MKRLLALLAGAAAGAAAAAILRRRAQSVGPQPDARAEDLRLKLAEARRAAAEEEDFEAAGMGPETSVEDEPKPTTRPSDPSPPANEFEAMRRRVHEEARAAAEEMRREPDEPA